MTFRVQLDLYHGPLDLLLHLVRRQEVEIAELPLAELTEQYLTYVTVLEQLDVDSIGEFLDVASTLIEIKSKLVLPQAPEDAEDEAVADAALDDPKQNLVERLLEFKKFRDAAGQLEERGAQWRRRFARTAPDLPRRSAPRDQQPIGQVELWDLVCAFGRVMQEKLEPASTTTIPYDETPVHVFMRRVYDRLVADREAMFSELFPESVHKSTLIATFLAVLELVRHGHALAEQGARYGDLRLRPGPEPLPAESRPAISVAAEPSEGAPDA